MSLYRNLVETGEIESRLNRPRGARIASIIKFRLSTSRREARRRRRRRRRLVCSPTRTTRRRGERRTNSGALSDAAVLSAANGMGFSSAGSFSIKLHLFLSLRNAPDASLISSYPPRLRLLLLSAALEFLIRAVSFDGSRAARSYDSPIRRIATVASILISFPGALARARSRIIK